ncbi:hypothetical protein ACSCB1_19585 [Streptomyces europaeiscabiei]|uniref:Uncharacterized protein n=1 Tax=Streptomyces europaeiscabiei TaxID=146819 RepID=A0ABU4NRG8_9ACTN|nr:hypothetical protein [Streptomyces europaeiscabiei]MDX2523017.1 hypothetical protein [Streptomyces europaeiscabiei]MDX2772492.1 hypothetical protein [Streptomyces europaeiscabiei]MDX3547259.1 hypothetical protein [Streptomyces europaeiscabiei]MDX3556820.1 hypothetical protein [Streptomyces europaeiscabiei]MDX3704668.1 hypothetical protein [Streptomyces europaeiscabiei]
MSANGSAVARKRLGDGAWTGGGVYGGGRAVAPAAARQRLGSTTKCGRKYGWRNG